LESSLDRWGWLILASTAVVVLGLVIEYWEPVGEFLEEWRRPAASFPWRKFWGLAGGILVTVGVAGELGFTYKASRVEGDLRTNNHKIEKSLNISAENAALAADRAKASADEAKKVAGTALDKSKAANDEAGDALNTSRAATDAAGKAEKRVGEVAKQADDLLAKYSDAENKLLKLRQSVTQRGQLLVEKQGLFWDTVRPFAEQKIEVRTNPSNIVDPSDREEMNIFAFIVKFSLSTAPHWSVSEAHGETGWGVEIILRRNSSPETKKAADALASAFFACGSPICTKTNWYQ
jgi:hypothetical protein